MEKMRALMREKNIPDIVVSRLPRYLQALERMNNLKQAKTSSQELAQILGLSAAQIRKDLSQFGEFGKQGTGYSIPYLIDQLQSILKVKHGWEIAVVGAGDLGHAIARYPGFSNRGFCVRLVFDNDPAKIGAKVGSLVIDDIANLEDRIRETGIKIAMLTVPAFAAQEVANRLAKSGIKAILNYAPIPLSLPPDVHVQNIDPIIHLQHMTFYLE
jgi:redox-sensing transcriptional repressor